MPATDNQQISGSDLSCRVGPVSRRRRLRERRIDGPHVSGVSQSEVHVSLDAAYQQMADARCDQHEVARAMDYLVPRMREWKVNSSDEQWQDLIRVCRSHALKDLFHQDPFTRRAFDKPRNYPGDAELIDYIYSPEEQWPVPDATPLGQYIFNYSVGSPAPEGVRARRGFVAHMIDRLATKIEMPNVLSIAAGHLRECNLSGAVKRGKLGRFVALDNDAASLEEVRRCYECHGVETVHDGIRPFLRGRTDLGRFDLVYSTGLFDYLQQSTGRRLVWGMFQMLRPGGRLMVANFLPDVPDVGYMEVFMDWQLIYRDRSEMVDLSMEIPEEEVRQVKVHSDEGRNIVFLEITKA